MVIVAKYPSTGMTRVSGEIETQGRPEVAICNVAFNFRNAALTGAIFVGWHSPRGRSARTSTLVQRDETATMIFKVVVNKGTRMP